MPPKKVSHNARANSVRNACNMFDDDAQDDKKKAEDPVE